MIIAITTAVLAYLAWCFQECQGLQNRSDQQ